MSSPDFTNIDASGANASVNEAWRLVLLNYAASLRKTLILGDDIKVYALDLKGADFKIVESALGPMAQEAVRIVEAYTIGTVSSADKDEALFSESIPPPPPEFGARLNIILNGIEPAAIAGLAVSDKSPSVIQSALWQLLYKVRESAEMAYARELDLVELDRRILFLLHNMGPLIPAEISGAVGVDKAQVSRSVKRLLEIKLIQRDQLRSPLQLTNRGQSQSERLLRLADMRNRELTFDIADRELENFFSVIEKLLDQAVVLYEQERQYSQGHERHEYPRPGAAVESENRGGEKIVLDRSRIISPLMTLSSYFSRSGSLAFKRLTGLSNFEAWVLNEIGMEPPISWKMLVERLDRDHSQAGRTISGLVERGLVSREGKPGRRHGKFSPSKEGQALYELIQDASRQRAAFLMAPLSQQERESFLATFEKIQRNAAVQLERERAFEEMG